MAHNFYRQAGGEDQVFGAESRLLENHGHFVYRFTRQNSDIIQMNTARVARDTLWNSAVYGEIRNTIRKERIDLVHFHNTFPLISPAAYYAARRENVPVVQSLHNYRLLCPGSLLYREGRVCESCLNRAVPWPGVLHSCYRNSRTATSGVAGMLTLHRIMRTWSRAVDTYIAFSEFSRDKFIEGGLPGDRITIKPNFLDVDPGPGDRGQSGNYALYVGRLTDDKGLQVLLNAWRELNVAVPLRIAGTGPLIESVRHQAQAMPNVEVLGARPHPEVLDLMKAASALIVPSLWYEGLPLTIIEAYATGLPVIASNIGSLASIVRDGITGYHFPAGDFRALARCVERMFTPGHNVAALGANAREAFLRNHSPEVSYKALTDIYRRAVAGRSSN